MAKSAPSLSIALCTCNGESFLEAQLASFLSQTQRPDEVVVGDDASDDATVRILDRFAGTAPFPVRIIRRQWRIGHTENFFATARECTGALIAFADQDDVWLDHKLAEARDVFVAHPEVLLVNQRALLCDSALAPRNNRPFPPDRQPGLHRTPHRALPLVWPGFLMTVRRQLLHDFDPALRPVLADGSLIGHGRWTFMLAAALGTYYMTSVPSARYRRHPAALTGDYRQSFSLAALGSRARAKVESQGHYARAAARSLMQIATAASSDDRRHLEAMAFEYARAADVFAVRSKCYGDGGLRTRLAAWHAASKHGAYRGTPLFSGGIRAAALDAGGVLGL